MFDTVHLEAPRLVGYASEFIDIARDLDRLEAEGRGKGWRLQGARQPYMRIANLETYGIPAILHQMPRWNKGNKKGDKIEFIGAGGMRISEMVKAARNIYKFDAEDAEIMRLDCTADVDDVPVSWFRDYTRVRHKRLGREYGRWEKLNRSVAETYTAGNKPNQLRIYDKTEQQKFLLQCERLKLPRNMRNSLTYEGMFHGLSPDRKVTRIENQMGARSPAKKFRVKFFGQIAEMASKPVFGNIVFPEMRRPSFEGIEGIDLFVARDLLRFRDDHGLRDAMHEFRRNVSRATFYRKWPMFEAFLQRSNTVAGITLAALHEEYRTSCLVQLAA